MDNNINSIPILILAGGRGTRLGALTNEIPKPMVEVNGKPFLDHLLASFISQNFLRHYVSIGYKKEIILNYFANSNITLIHEDLPLGTGGAIKKGLDLINDPYTLVVNGDTLFDINLTHFITTSIEHFNQNPHLNISIACCDSSTKGNISFKTKPYIKFNPENHQDLPLLNGGIYLLRKEIRSQLPSMSFSFEHEFLENQKNIIGFSYSDFFIDIGTPADYFRAQKLLNS